MADHEGSNFNDVTRQIIEKSLFTERQIEIILERLDLLEVEFPITHGAYYRQVTQSREKFVAFLHTLVLLKGLGVLSNDSISVMDHLSERVGVINQRDVICDGDKVVDVIDSVIRKTLVF